MAGNVNDIGDNTNANSSGVAMPIAGAAPQGTQSQPRTARRMSSSWKAAVYLVAAFMLTVAMLGIIVDANRRYAPEYYQPDYMTRVADALASGRNYAVFDLNINIRKLREEQFKRLEAKPRLVILGASQWQEAAASLMPDRSFINGHVHRDYYEDVLGMADLLVRSNKLPSDLVITIRDRLFTPVDKRTDFLWLPGVPYYQSMASRLALPALGFWEAFPLQRLRELASLSMLFSNATRWHNAKELPRATAQDHVATLDVLHPDGSITWSDEHRAIFTQERSRKLAIAHAEASRSRPPLIDPKGVEALDRLLAYLSLRGVRVHLAHPPFNPIFFARVQNTPYMEGLREVDEARHELLLVEHTDHAHERAVDAADRAVCVDDDHADGRAVERGAKARLRRRELLLLADARRDVAASEQHRADGLVVEQVGERQLDVTGLVERGHAHGGRHGDRAVEHLTVQHLARRRLHFHGHAEHRRRRQIPGRRESQARKIGRPEQLVGRQRLRHCLGVDVRSVAHVSHLQRRRIP